MKTPTSSGPVGEPSAPSPIIVTGLSLLVRARNAALELRLNPWDLAVGLPTMIAAGLTVADVRWIVAGGFSQHGQERKPTSSVRRSFRRTADLALTAQSRLVITPTGEKLFTSSISLVGANDPAAPVTPHWDADRRQLQYGSQLVKKYRRQAICQETVLAAFQEDGWPPRIDDPLPRVDDIDPKSRLHETVRRLNRAQLPRLLVFQRDGTGEGVTWGEYVDEPIRLPLPVPSPLVRYRTAKL
jgi:hypothetical protein